MKVTEVAAGIVGAVVLFNILAAMNGSHDTALSVIEKATSVPLQPQQPAHTPGTYGLNEVQQMTDDAYKNEMSFNHYYKGHPFDAVMAFKTSHDHPILGGGYSVDFDSAACQDVTDPAIISMIAGWQAGQMARVTGVIETVTFNTLILTSCRISADTPAQTASTEVVARAQATEAAPQASTAQPAPAPFQLGKDARRAWEGWFASTSGKFRQGAEWWADYRSRHPSCASLSDDQWQAGCIAAKAQLDQVDAHRNADPQYRAGWNQP